MYAKKKVDKRSALLIIIFALVTPFVWEVLCDYIRHSLPINLWLSTIIVHSPENAVYELILRNITSSFFACLIIAFPLGLLLRRKPVDSAVSYAVLSCFNLLLLFYLNSTSGLSYYPPIVTAEVSAYVMWLMAGALLGSFFRKKVFHLDESESVSASV